VAQDGALNVAQDVISLWRRTSSRCGAGRQSCGHAIGRALDYFQKTVVVFRNSVFALVGALPEGHRATLPGRPDRSEGRTRAAPPMRVGSGQASSRPSFDINRAGCSYRIPSIRAAVCT